jgi:hypothetical protein
MKRDQTATSILAGSEDIPNYRQNGKREVNLRINAGSQPDQATLKSTIDSWLVHVLVDQFLEHYGIQAPSHRETPIPINSR